MTDRIIILLLFVTLLFVIGLYGRFRESPATVRALVQEELAKTQAQSERALQEALAAKADSLLAGIRLYHDQIDQRNRAEANAAAGRARAAETAVAEVTTALDAATRLVHELRGAVDERGAHAAPDEPDTVDTTDEPEEEETKLIVKRRSAPGALRVVGPTRAAINPPPVEGEPKT